MDEPQLSEDTTVEVTALKRSRTFGSKQELATFVSEVIDSRGGIFDPFEIAAIQRLAALNGGPVDSEVRRIARATTFHGPKRNETRLPTPFDERIQAAEEADAEAEGEMWAKLEARRTVEQKHKRAVFKVRRQEASEDQKATNTQAVTDRYRALWSQAEEAYQDARRRATRARARLNALRQAASTWRAEQRVRFHNADDPASPLTQAELDERRGRQ